MAASFFSSLLKGSGSEPFIGIDIGTSSIKAMSLDISGHKPKLLGCGQAPTPASAINNNAVRAPEQIGKAISSIIEANEILGTKVVFAVPGPAVFTKKITIAYTDLKSLDENMTFEASNYIPHRVDAVHLDYQVLKVNGTATMDVLLVAVKNEIITSYVQAIEAAGLEASIADVDYFALENMFELAYPEEKPKTVALVNVGSRYTSVSIVQNGESMFAGDIGVGGRLYTDALCESLGMNPADADRAKTGQPVEGYDEHLVGETIERTTEHVASELHRQLGFFWNAAATDKSIESVFLCGGGAQAPGLLDELSSRTGLVCTRMAPLHFVDCGDKFDEDFVREVQPSMGVCVGLALRRFGDKQHAF